VSERAKTIAVAAVVLLVIVVAGLDWLTGRSPQAAQSPSSKPLQGSVLPLLPKGVFQGTIWYADADCRIIRVDLATLRHTAVTPGGGHCRFWISPDGSKIAMHIGSPFTAPEDLEVLDLHTGAITRPFHRPDLGVSAPAWSPDSQTLVACDANHVASRLLSLDIATGTVRTIRRSACYPGYAGKRLVYQSTLGGSVILGRKKLADAGTLGTLLHAGVDQIPGPAAAGDTVAVPATTVPTSLTVAPHTIILFYDSAGRLHGRWDTGVAADTVGLLDHGKFAYYTRPGQTVVYQRQTGDVFLDAEGTILAAAASPDGRTLALSNPAAIVFTDVASNRQRFELPVVARWLAWTPDG
jgi:hypothetical protein